MQDDGTPEVPLKFPEEFVAHKVLDLLGDLFVAVASPVFCGVLGIMSGHSLNCELGRELREMVTVG